MSFISTAYAATPAAGGGATHTPSMMPLFVIVILMVLFYVWMWRKQNAKNKAQKDLLGSISKGDEVMTTGGMLGRVVSVDDTQVILEVSKETEITFQKSAVSTVLPKGTIKS